MHCFFLFERERKDIDICYRNDKTSEPTDNVINNSIRYDQRGHRNDKYHQDLFTYCSIIHRTFEKTFEIIL